MSDSNLTPRGWDDDLFVRMTAVWLRNPTTTILQHCVAAVPFSSRLLFSKTGPTAPSSSSPSPISALSSSTPQEGTPKQTRTPSSGSPFLQRSTLSDPWEDLDTRVLLLHRLSLGSKLQESLSRKPETLLPVPFIQVKTSSFFFPARLPLLLHIEEDTLEQTKIPP